MLFSNFHYNLFFSRFFWLGLIKEKGRIKGRGIGCLRGLVLVSSGGGDVFLGEEEAVKESQKQHQQEKLRKEKKKMYTSFGSHPSNFGSPVGQTNSGLVFYEKKKY